MALQIDAPETISLIERISKLTGESEEMTVEVALRERLERLEQPEDKERKRQRLQALADSLAARFKASGQPLVDHGELLYGEVCRRQGLGNIASVWAVEEMEWPFNLKPQRP
jgi:hypothetical protein